MNGTVIRIRPRGVEVLVNSIADSLTSENKFEIYRISDSVETILATMCVRRIKDSNTVNLNYLDQTRQDVGIVLGDLVRLI